MLACFDSIVRVLDESLAWLFHQQFQTLFNLIGAWADSARGFLLHILVIWKSVAKGEAPDCFIEERRVISVR